MDMTFCAVLASVMLLVGSGQSVSQQRASSHPAASPPTRCVDFDSGGRLQAGTDFRVSLLHGLELRLIDQGLNWGIRVGPIDESLDYLWPVSPPLRTAPQRVIGDGYGMTARESASLGRQLRFTLSRADDDEAVAVIDSERSADEVLRRLEQLGRGQLRLEITDYALRPHPRPVVDGAPDVFEWITFKGRACAPERPEF
jgi:hypothetical protein